MAQELVKKQTRKEKREQDAEQVAAKRVDTDKLKASLDAIIDDIDEVLDSEAEALVKSFVQKGGE